MVPLVSSAWSSQEAWTRVAQMYTKKSHGHIIYLKDKFSQITCRCKSEAEFLLSIKNIVNKLGAPPSDANLLLYNTYGLEHAYKELIAALHNQDPIVPFEELYDQLVNHDIFLHHGDVTPKPNPPTVNLTCKIPLNNKKPYPSKHS